MTRDNRLARSLVLGLVGCATASALTRRTPVAHERSIAEADAPITEADAPETSAAAVPAPMAAAPVAVLSQIAPMRLVPSVARVPPVALLASVARAPAIAPAPAFAPSVPLADRGPRRRRRAATIVKVLGLLIGVGVMAAAVSSWRVRSTGEVLGADIQFVAAPSGELEVAQSGAVLTANGLKPDGRQARGSVAVRNITGRGVRVRIRALPSNGDLDPILRVDAEIGHYAIMRGHLGDMRRWSTRTIYIDRGATALLSLRAGLDPAAQSRYSGLITQVTLELRAAAVKA